MINQGLVLGALAANVPDLIKSRLPNDGAASPTPAIAAPASRRARAPVPTCVALAGPIGQPGHHRALIETPTTRCSPPRTSSCRSLGRPQNAYAMGIAFAVGKNEKAGGTAGSIACTTSSRRSWRKRGRDEPHRRQARRSRTRDEPRRRRDLDVPPTAVAPGASVGSRHGLRATKREPKMGGATLECSRSWRLMRSAVAAGSVPKTTFADCRCRAPDSGRARRRAGRPADRQVLRPRRPMSAASARGGRARRQHTAAKASRRRKWHRACRKPCQLPMSNRGPLAWEQDARHWLEAALASTPKRSSLLAPELRDDIVAMSNRSPARDVRRHRRGVRAARAAASCGGWSQHTRGGSARARPPAWVQPPERQGALHDACALQDPHAARAAATRHRSQTCARPSMCTRFLVRHLTGEL